MTGPRWHSAREDPRGAGRVWGLGRDAGSPMSLRSSSPLRPALGSDAVTLGRMLLDSRLRAGLGL